MNPILLLFAVFEIYFLAYSIRTGQFLYAGIFPGAPFTDRRRKPRLFRAMVVGHAIFVFCPLLIMTYQERGQDHHISLLELGAASLVLAVLVLSLTMRRKRRKGRVQEKEPDAL